MSDIFELNIYYHVFTPDCDVKVSDSNAGDQVVADLAQKYPNASVVVKDRYSDEILGDEVSILELLQAKQRLLAVRISCKNKEVK